MPRRSPERRRTPPPRARCRRPRRCDADRRRGPRFAWSVQVEGAVTGEELEHVIQEPDPRPHVVAPLAVERQPQRDRRLRRDAIDGGSPHRTSSSAASNARVCSDHARRHAQAARDIPGRSSDRARERRGPRVPAATRSGCPSNLASTKLAALFQYGTPRRLEHVVEHRLRLRDLTRHTSRSTRCRRRRPAARRPRTR